ncbi:hypothetical protein ACHAW6_013710 [Cyclotella cf. meneghiniana]
MQHVMKANGEVKDRSTLRLLTPETLTSMRSVSWTATPKSVLRMSLQRRYTPSAMPMVMHMSCWTLLWTSAVTQMLPLAVLTRSRSLTAQTLSDAPPMAGSYVVHRKMVALLGRSCLTSKSLTHSRLLSLPSLQALPLNQPLTDECLGSSRRENG